MSNFLKLATERYSVRSYKGTPVEQDKIDTLLEAARVAPTACNNQPWRIKILTDADDLAFIDRITPYRFGAPLVFMIAYDSAASWKNPLCEGVDSGYVDASIAITHMMLQAADLGLGTLWVGYFDIADFCEHFKLPETIVPVALLPVGYPADDVKPNPLHDKSLDIGQLII